MVRERKGLKNKASERKMERSGLAGKLGRGFRAGVVTVVFAATAFGQDQGAPKKPEAPAAQAAPAPAAPTQAPTAAPAKSPAAAAVDASRYIIGAEDALQITVWKEPALSGTVPVRPDGMISLVLAGDLLAAGRTPMQ